MDAAYPVRMTVQHAILLRFIVDGLCRKNGVFPFTRRDIDDELERYGEGRGFEFIVSYSTIKHLRKVLSELDWGIELKTIHGVGWMATGTTKQIWERIDR